MIPRTTVNDDNQTVSSRSPSLEPRTARNRDLTAEYYFEPAGMLFSSVHRLALSTMASVKASGPARSLTAGQSTFESAYPGEHRGFESSHWFLKFFEICRRAVNFQPDETGEFQPIHRQWQNVREMSHGPLGHKH
ncbi:MAG: hypothetical protein EXS37_21745 [Opitutus sp.]|nr:hypothetical protein [Opitutus sp.]